MPEATTPPPATATAAKTKPARSELNQSLIKELTLAGQIAGTTEKDGYAALLAEEGIDATFLTNLRGKIGEAEDLLNGATGKRADQKSTTQREEKLKRALLAKLKVIQTRAKRKYRPGNPLREKFFIGERLESSRTLLENGAQSIVKTLASDPLPGMKPAEAIALQEALRDYRAVQTDQTGDQSEAATRRAALEAKVKEVADLRREIQYAVDAVWPAEDKANAGIRVEFQIPPNRALN